MPSSHVIGDHFEQFIGQQIESARYASASEVLREALRTLEGRERLREIEIEEYRAKIREGIASAGRSADEVLVRLEAKYQAMIDSQA